MRGSGPKQTEECQNDHRKNFGAARAFNADLAADDRSMRGLRCVLNNQGPS